MEAALNLKLSLVYSSRFATPLGELLAVVREDGALARLHFLRGRSSGLPAPRTDPARCAHVAAQLAEYFEGRRRDFDLALAPEGTLFQQAVWSELCRIPYGSRVAYSDVAGRIGRPAAVRAVGAANGANPIAIVVPCHRVVGKSGALTGYGSGLPIKQWLLDHEAGLRRLPLSDVEIHFSGRPQPAS
jgi:methylated-DNA-[protein]-cysteine S-methyltransferase